MTEQEQYLQELVAQYHHHAAEWRKHGSDRSTPRYRQMRWLAGRIDLLRPDLKIAAVDEDGRVELVRMTRHDLHIATVRRPRERITSVRC